MSEDKIERAKELAGQIAVLQKELDTMEGLLELKDRHAMSLSEKEDAFDKIYDLALEQVKHVLAHGRNPKDAYRYLYEMAMSATLGENVWDIINTYAED